MKLADKWQSFYHKKNAELDGDDRGVEDVITTRFIINLIIQTGFKWEDRGFPDKVYLGDIDDPKGRNVTPLLGRRATRVRRFREIAVPTEEQQAFTSRLASALGLNEDFIALSSQKDGIMYSGKEHSICHLWCKTDPEAIDSFSANTSWFFRNEIAHLMIVGAMEAAKGIKESQQRAQSTPSTETDVKITPPTPGDIKQQRERGPGNDRGKS